MVVPLRWLLGTYCWLLNAASAYFACKGTELISEVQWQHVKKLRDLWLDLDLAESRVALRRLDALISHGGLNEAANDCGFGLLILALSSLRALDYDRPAEARELFFYVQGLRDELESSEPQAKVEEWSISETAPDLSIYPALLGLHPKHDCGGTPLKIFVYDMPDPYTAGTLHCHHGQWGVEVLIPNYLRRGTCRTLNPDEADFFMVPWFTWCERMVYNRSAVSGKLPQRYLELMGNRSELMPYWDRHQGMDHIFIFGDQGMNYFPRWREFIHSSVFLLTEALTPECGPSCFQPWKDIIIPGHTDFFRYRRMRALNLPSEERQLLLNFHGRHPGTGPSTYHNNTVRGSIITVFQELPACSVGGFVADYFEIMGNSHFCLVPMGTSSWTNHLYEAFFAGCIPVILSDNFSIPFQSLLPWDTMSIKWPMHRVADGLYQHLLAMPTSKLKEMKQQVDKYACAFDFHLQLDPTCSPYQYVLRELEIREPLLKRLRRTSFWNHV